MAGFCCVACYSQGSLAPQGRGPSVFVYKQIHASMSRQLVPVVHSGGGPGQSDGPCLLGDSSRVCVTSSALLQQQLSSQLLCDVHWPGSFDTHSAASLYSKGMPKLRCWPDPRLSGVLPVIAGHAVCMYSHAPAFCPACSVSLLLGGLVNLPWLNQMVINLQSGHVRYGHAVMQHHATVSRSVLRLIMM